jgi:carbon storage regulator CsrA
MLVLTRKQRESIVIGGDSSMHPGLTVTVLEVRGGKVKLGFTADPGISIQRSEVWEKVHAGEVPNEHTEEVKALDRVVMPGGLFLTGALARKAGTSFKEKQ